jgi:hypothetical protein
MTNPDDDKIIVYWEMYYNAYVACFESAQDNLEYEAHGMGTTPEMALSSFREFLEEMEAENDYESYYDDQR